MATPPSLSDALLDGFVGQFYRETDGVRDLLESLNEGNPQLTLPQIVVVGQESSGKSSVLESLAMLPLFPRDEHICTRMPIHLKLRRDASSASSSRKKAPTVEMRLVYADDRPPIESQKSLDQVVPLMREWMDQIVTQDAGALRGVVNHVLEIHVTSPDVPTLDLVDLPGIVAGRLEDEPDNMMEQTRALVEKYLRMPHTLVLAVVPAGERVRNSQAFQLVQQTGLTHRTIGVLTMVDRAADLSNPRGPFADVMARLDGRSGDIVALDPYGYVAVMSRDTRLNESDQLPLGRFKTHETQWLKSHLEGYVERGLASSGVLAVKVAKMLTQHVRESWVPLTLEQLAAQATQVAQEVVALGKSSRTLVKDLMRSGRDVRITTLKQLMGASLLRAASTADSQTIKLIYVLRGKMDSQLQQGETNGFFRYAEATSVAAAMARREALGGFLDQHIQAIVMSAVFRLTVLVRNELTSQQTTASDAYHTAVFDKIYLLASSMMWTKAEDLLSSRDLLVDRVVSTMDQDQSAYTAPPPHTTPPSDEEAKFFAETVEMVSMMLYVEHERRDLPRPLESVQYAFDRPTEAGMKKEGSTSEAPPAEPTSHEEARRLFLAITRHVIGPLLCELMGADTMADVAVGYLSKYPDPRESPLHWFNESTASKRRDLTDRVKRLEAAREGLAGLL